MKAQDPASAGRQVVRTRHPYLFRSLITHHTCERRMQGNWAHNEAYYRCRYPQEYAVANTLDHPLSV